MSTNALAGSSVSIKPERRGCSPTELPFSISATTSVNADRLRIYQALTIPEYIEAWFCAPSAIAGSTQVSAKENSFSIIGRCTQHEQFAIFCSYQVRRRSKVVLTWQHCTRAETGSSMVRIRLLGDFGRTTVHVVHVGLTLSNRQWHEAMWGLSLGKLSKLF